MAFSEDLLDELALIFAQNIENSIKNGIDCKPFTLEEIRRMFYTRSDERITELFAEYGFDMSPVLRPQLRVIKGGKSQE